MVGAASAALAGYRVAARAASGGGTIAVTEVEPGEDVFAYIGRVKGGFDQTLYRQLLGAANDFKEGDQAIGVAAADETTRANARALLANTKIRDLHEHPLLVDELQRLIWQTTDQAQYAQVQDWTMGQLKEFLLTASEPDIKGVMYGLTSDTIGCVPKLMDNQELIALGQKIFNVVPGTRMGAKGYMGARIQPNSPTDHPDDVVWQVFDAFAYATGDIVIGTNPVDSTVASVAAVENALKDLVDTFGLQDTIPWCVLSHIDVQAEVAEHYPGTVATMFQSLAGTDDCNKIFDVTIPKIMKYAQSKQGERYGLYFETGQGSEFTNGAANGVDMMVLESRKYGFSRAVGAELAKVQPKGAWLHVNDVAGFIGPEVFKDRQQLVRCCLEDIVMGKLHGLPIGLDVCSTLHMSVSLEDLDWCQEQVMPANPVYLIALPTKNDPMLGYLYDLVPGPCPAAGKVRLQGRRCDVVVLPADRDRRSGRQVYRALRRSLLGLLPIPAGQERPPAQGRHLRGRPGEDARGRGARRRPRDRSRRADLGSQPAARGQGQRALRRCESVPLGRAHPRVHRLHPQCPAAAHPVRRPQRLHRPSGHRRDVEPGIHSWRWKPCGHRGAATRPRARSSSPTA